MSYSSASATPTHDLRHERWGAPGSHDAKRLLLLGSGELGREVALEAMRLGIEVIAVDAYEKAPAMQFAQRCYVTNMLDGKALEDLVEQVQPDLIVPEVEAIATNTLIELEKAGWRVIPTALATNLTMDREGIRRLAAVDLNLKTSPYRFASTVEEYREAVEAIGLPCVVKPVMSSSGKGQSTVRTPEQNRHCLELRLGSRSRAGSQSHCRGLCRL